MRPLQLARTECAGLLPDEGRCLWAEPAALHDHSLPLPTWLSPARWADLVSQAREAGEDVVSVRVRQTPDGLQVIRQTADDNRQALALPILERLAIGKRHDLYFCPGCGARIGSRGALPQKLPGGVTTTGTMCGKCSPMKDRQGGRACQVKLGNRCGHFERAILPLADKPSPKAAPKLQGKRLAAREAYLLLRPPAQTPKAAQPGGLRRCPDCGEPIAKRKRICPTCAAKRRRVSYRGRHQRTRGQRATVNAETAVVSPC